jgi:hypothetical protein
MPPGRLAAINGLTGIRPAIGDLGRMGAAICGAIIIGFIKASLFGFLMFVHVFYDFMMLVVTSSVFTIMVVMVLVTIDFMFFHVVYMMFSLMMMLMTSGKNMFFVFWMIHNYSLTGFAAAFHGFTAAFHASC